MVLSLSAYPSVPYELGKPKKRSRYSLLGLHSTVLPLLSSTSISLTVSCTRPYLNEDDSMPHPTVAPPIVMDLSCGTTAGMTSCLRHSLPRREKGVIPSTSTKLRTKLTRST